jgi:hypothetical protein
MQRIIGITGKAGAGKSEVARIIVDLVGGEIAPFARPLKNVAISLGWNGDKDLHGRMLLQELGTTIREHVSKEKWVDLWKKSIADVTDIIIADDVRYDNEALAIRSKSGIIINVQGRQKYRKANRFERCFPGLSRTEDTHPSERGISPTSNTVSIRNRLDTSHYELREQVKKMLVFYEYTSVEQQL